MLEVRGLPRPSGMPPFEHAHLANNVASRHTPAPAMWAWHQMTPCGALPGGLITGSLPAES
jgi:hypothetical protein